MNDAYQLIKEENLQDVHAKGTFLVHKKTGARIALLANEDPNKVFTIAFRTPPANSTGVAHIIEHTVLCGSQKFPLKDPFVELAKGSLNTFLNAITYSDKTMYPVASCNDVDFRNLMEVYLDAVFYPNIYREKKIFLQEGWHYHLENADDPLTYNGVVYNEMKGAFSTADDVLQRTIMNTLFPDTPYGVESGGDPEVIPQLTYEEFLDFHRKYYHPSNSYIYLYGNADMEERLAWLDREYLSHFDRITVESAIPDQKSFAQLQRTEDAYPILDAESEEEKTYLSWNTVVTSWEDPVEVLAFAILEYVLFSVPGAPVKQALLDAQIGKSIESSFEDGISQPYLTVIARGAEAADEERFAEVIRHTLEDICAKGIDARALASGINYFEFRFREADYGSYPKGLVYGIDMFNSWLYRDDEPFLYLHALEYFDALKEKAKEGYFEQLIRDRLLQNAHQSMVILKPAKGLAAAREKKAADALAAYKATLSEEEIQAIVEETAALQAYQEEEDPPEIVATVPLLSREDIQKETPRSISVEETEASGVRILRHHYETNGIAYLSLLFDTAQIPQEKLPYLGVLKSVLGRIRTEHFEHGDLFHEINANSGGIQFGLAVYPVERGEKGDVGYGMLGIRAKYLYAQQDFVFSMIKEILGTSQLEDTKRLKEILDSGLAGLQHSLQAAGHVTAVTRALGARSPLSAWTDATSGLGEYRFLETLCSGFDEHKEEIVATLKELMQIIFRPENLIVSMTADDEGFAGIEEAVVSFRDTLAGSDADPRPGTPVAIPEADGGKTISEAFATSGRVQYVAMAGTYRDAGLSYTGHLRVLKTILSYDYLWMNIRVLGGAYGCMTAMKRSGDGYLVSYRDPHLAQTLDVFRGLPAYLQAIELDDRTMTKYIIGTISETDMPMNASAKGAFALTAYFLGLTEEMLQQERDEILACTEEDIRSLAAYAQAVIDTASICVVGSDSAITKHKELFDTTENLITV